MVPNRVRVLALTPLLLMLIPVLPPTRILGRVTLILPLGEMRNVGFLIWNSLRLGMVQ